jgi:hypothetical protein
MLSRNTVNRTRQTTWGTEALDMLFGGDITCVIVWTRNNKVYRATVDRLTQESDARLQ